MSKEFWCSIFVACSASFSFGFNWSNLNTIQLFVKCFLLTNHQGIDYNSFCSNSTAIEDADYEPITAKWASVASFASLGATISAFVFGFVVESIGRKKSAIIIFVLSISGNVIAATSFFTSSYAQLLSGRIVNGLSIAATTTLFAPYLQEIAPKGKEPFYGSLLMIFINLGFIVAQIFGLPQLLGRSNIWWIVLVGELPLSVLCLILSFTFFSRESCLVESTRRN